MSVTATPLVDPGAAPTPLRSRVTLPKVLLAVAGLLLLLSVVRALTGADDLTSSGTVGATLRLAVPIGLAGLGGLWAERAGVVNIGLEGMMILGTWFGAWAGYQWGPWTGVVAGIVGGALGGLLHALATVSFGVDHIVSGVAINILALGLTQFLAGLIFAKAPGGGPRQSPPVEPIGTLTMPVLSGGNLFGWESPDLLGALERRHWVLLSDLAGIVRGATADVSQLTLLAILLVPLSYFLLWRTPFGLRLRSCGENPYAADSLGVKVYRMKYVAVVASGAFAGLGGAFLVTVASPLYQDGQTGGRGYIGLAAMIFGNWRPTGLAAGALLFGFTDALNLRSGGESVHALLLFLTILLLGLAGYALYRGRRVQAAVSVAFAAALFVWFVRTDAVPGELVSFTPHLTTLLVLSLASQRLRPPAADGVIYRRGEE